MKNAKRFLALAIVLASLLALAGCTAAEGYPMRNRNHCRASIWFFDEPLSKEEAFVDIPPASNNHGYLSRSQNNKLKKYINSVSDWKWISEEESRGLVFIGMIEIMENPVSRFYFTEDGQILFISGLTMLNYGRLSDKGTEFLLGLK